MTWKISFRCRDSRFSPPDKEVDADQFAALAAPGWILEHEQADGVDFVLERAAGMTLFYVEAERSAIMT